MKQNTQTRTQDEVMQEAKANGEYLYNLMNPEKSGLKTFADLDFQDKDNGLSGGRAKLDFSNGYGVSVITGQGSFTSEASPYELAVLDKDGLCYDSGLTDDVEGYLTEEDVTMWMADIQKLPRKL